MRRVNDDDKQTIQLLKEGTAAAKGAAAATSALNADAVAHMNKLSDQVRLLQYSLSRVLQTLASYSSVKNQVEQLDYRTLGIARAIEELKLTDSFNDLVEKHAKQVRVDAFNELSDSDDKDRGFEIADADEITLDHVVILTSECATDPDQGIFRSKMDVGGAEFSDLKDSFLGKKVGDTVEAKIQGHDHLVTILSLRKKPAGEKSDGSQEE